MIKLSTNFNMFLKNFDFLPINKMSSFSSTTFLKNIYDPFYQFGKRHFHKDMQFKLLNNKFEMQKFCRLYSSKISGHNDEGSAIYNALTLDIDVKDKLLAIQKFVENGGDVNWVNNGHSPLFYVIHYECNAPYRYQLITELFKHGALIYWNEYKQGSPLHDIIVCHSSAYNKIAALAAILNSKQIDINCTNIHNQTALDYAQRIPNKNDRKLIVNFLASYGAKKL